MAHFAQIDENGIVTRVIVVANADITDRDTREDDEAMGVAICRYHFGPDTNWVQTSYNGNFRNQFAGAGALYDPVHDVFRAVDAPHPSWSLGEETGLWEAPVPYQPGYGWEEAVENWVQPEQPFPSWVWTQDPAHSERAAWEPPVPKPAGQHRWDEDAGNWVAL